MEATRGAKGYLVQFDAVHKHIHLFMLSFDR